MYVFWGQNCFSYTDTIFRNSVLPFNSSRTLLGFPTSYRLERLVAPHPNFHTLTLFLIWLGKIFGHHFQYFHTLTMFLWIRQDFWFTIFMPPTISLDLCIQYAKRETPQINFTLPSILTLAWKAVILCAWNTSKCIEVISNSSRKIASHPNP